MRGKEIRAALCSLDAGITPAYAGKSQHGFYAGAQHLGSPPPMRGKVDQNVCFDELPGITPAYAGKRSDKKQMHHTLQDHPRLCGEKFPQFYFSQTVYRITPAYAGKSEITDEGSSIRRDHPRLCGEKSTRCVVYCIQRGSPPPMRGKGYYTDITFDETGITPAYAGKRQSWQAASFAYGDHPRLCGEKL